MEYSKADSLSATVSLLGFGAMRLPLRSEDISDVDVDAVCKMVDAAMAGGVNYYDTAYGYHKGNSETALRKALVERYDRDSYYLADKLAVFLCHSPEDQRKMFDTQLERCNVRYFDFYHVHAVTDERYAQCQAFRSFDFLREMKEKGRAKRVGFSFHSTPDMLERVLDEHPYVEFVQLQINYLDWKAQRAQEYHRIAHERGLPILIMEPVKGGSLAKLAPAAAALSPALATPEGQAAFALKFAASRPGVLCVLSGMTTLEQTKSNIEAFSDPAIRTFDDEDEKLLEAVLDETRKISQVPCTACEYCAGVCPKHIDIPKIFSIYNEYKRSGVQFHAHYLYSCIKEDRRADACIACRACVEKCPQGIDIPSELKKLHPELPVISLVPDAAARG
jgi:predicted aldo/keto reductase-like oxidoreductase